jgi:hypothetical protein
MRTYLMNKILSNIALYNNWLDIQPASSLLPTEIHLSYMMIEHCVVTSNTELVKTP